MKTRYALQHIYSDFEPKHNSGYQNEPIYNLIGEGIDLDPEDIKTFDDLESALAALNEQPASSARVIDNLSWRLKLGLDCVRVDLYRVEERICDDDDDDIYDVDGYYYSQKPDEWAGIPVDDDEN